MFFGGFLWTKQFTRNIIPFCKSDTIYVNHFVPSRSTHPAQPAGDKVSGTINITHTTKKPKCVSSFRLAISQLVRNIMYYYVQPTFKYLPLSIKIVNLNYEALGSNMLVGISWSSISVCLLKNHWSITGKIISSWESYCEFTNPYNHHTLTRILQLALNEIDESKAGSKHNAINMLDIWHQIKIDSSSPRRFYTVP